MNMTMQLDYFGDAGGRTAMHMDRASQWALPESEPAAQDHTDWPAATDNLSLSPGARRGAGKQDGGAGDPERGELSGSV